MGYTCPVCGAKGTAFTTCQRPDCADGRMPMTETDEDGSPKPVDPLDAAKGGCFAAMIGIVAVLILAPLLLL